MHHRAYREIADDDASAERENEAMALEHAITLLREGQEKGMDSVEAVKARHFTRRLWYYFLDDLTMPENALPEELRANLISIGIWVLRELERIEQGERDSFTDIMDVMGMIRDGLK